MRTRLLTLLTTSVVAAAPLALLAGPAQAATCSTAPTVLATQVLPKTVVVDTTGVSPFDVVVAVRDNGCAVSSVRAVVSSPSATAEPEMTAGPAEDGVTTYAGGFDLTAGDLANAEAGRWKVRVTTAWEGGSEGTSASFSVLRSSAVTADATVARIKKGKTLTVKGTLSRADWEKGSSVGYGKQRVELQFRTTGGRYQKVKTLQARAGGTFAQSVKASKDGCFRVVFRGSSTTAPATSAGDCIDVR